MASTNFKLFDENKTNMMSDTEYNINTQRLNGVQAGIASSQLQNKTLYQTSLVAYSLAQIMMQNGYDANDSAAVSAFVGNMSNSLLQKVLDKATSAEAQAGTVTNKWISPATMKAAALLLSGGTMSGPINMGNNKITNLADPTDSLDSANKKYVDDSLPFKKIKIADNLNLSFSGGKELTLNYPTGFTTSDSFNTKFILCEIFNFNTSDRNSFAFGTYDSNNLLLNVETAVTISKVSALLTANGKELINGTVFVYGGHGNSVLAIFRPSNILVKFYSRAQLSARVSLYVYL